MLRHFFNARIEHLEEVVQRPDTPEETLQLVREELKHRSTARALGLRRRLEQRLEQLETSKVPETVSSRDIPLERLSPSVRAAGLFDKLGLKTVGDLVERTPSELLRQRNCGRRTISELQGKLQDYGLSLSDPEQDDSQKLGQPAPPEILSVPLAHLNLSARARSFLARRRIAFVGDLCQLTEHEVWRTPNVGRKTVHELRQALDALGLRFGSLVGSWSSKACKGAPLPTLPANLQPPEPEELEEALRARVQTISASERNTRWTIEHMGWDGRPGRTLEAIGQPEGVTRERVRQVAAKCCRELKSRQSPPQALIRTLELIGRHAPLGQPRLDALMRENRLASSPFHIAGVRTAAQAFGLSFPFEVTDRSDTALILPLGLKCLPRQLLRAARSEVGARGCIVDDQLLQISKQISTSPVDLEIVHTILESDESFSRINGAPNWWWRPEKARRGRNRLVNTIIKVLAANPIVSLQELRQSVRRHVRSGNVAPPTFVLRALCEALPYVSISDDKVERIEQSMDWSGVLSETDSILCRIFAHRGPVLHSYELSKEGMSAGLNENSLSIYKTYSPLLWRPAPSHYALIGSNIPAGLIEDRQSRAAGHQRSIIDSGWISDHTLFICYRITKSVWYSGTVTAPSSVKRVLKNTYRLLALGSSEVGALVVRRDSITGLRPFFRIFGAEEGDTLFLVIDVRQGACSAWLGGEELARAIQSGRAGTVLSELSKAGNVMAPVDEWESEDE